MRDEAAIGWCGGFIDGEGCFLLGKTKGGVNAIICAMQVKMEPLYFLQDTLGVGTIKPMARRTTTRNQVHRWAVTNKKDILYVCERLKPYIVGKADDLRLMQQFVTTYGVHGQKITDERRAIREAVYQEYLLIRKRTE